ncbi:MAG TPA: glycoside hydrolase family 2 TIM barrel-domain containing protein [Flavisolibacter sp.]|jgi:hypothetical protein|nr:glycoside hydrolase family 2 TIM barrel-domain containing protein [Flavisolibacter sp.]
MNRIICLLTCICFFMQPANVFAQNAYVKQVQLSRFQLQSSALINDDGSRLSLPGYHSKIYWFPVTVPSTVLTGLVANKVYPDPYTGLNNMFIPDASDEFNQKYQLEHFTHLPDRVNPWKKPYWYRTVFSVPAGDKGKYFQLLFKGINYRAEAWLNGQLIADSSQMAGMFAEYSWDVSKQILAGADNVLAVKIFPLDYPGLPAQEQLHALGDFFENGGPKGDIGKNVTMLCSVGWDWMPPARDRNIGIWQPVYLRATGAVTIARPKLVTELPALPDTSIAKLSLDLTLFNRSDKNESGNLTVWISPENFAGKTIRLSRNISVSANTAQSVRMDENSAKELGIRQPHLWWPNGYGKANLYRIRIQFKNGSTISDDTSFVFGIRTVGSKAMEVNGYFRRDFYVNGKRVHLTGGAWVPDMLVNRDSTRYDYELHLCRNANINLVRIWGGGITPPDEFFNAADRYGLLVWSDFWITGDTQGEFKGSSDWPMETNVFIQNMTSTIYRIRNHPSLLVWTGGNEGHARKELYDAMRDSVIALDGTRPFIPSSSGYAKLLPEWKASWPDDKPSGVYSGGPYSWKEPQEYYRRVNAGKDWLFKDETGLPSQPPYNSLSKIIPDLVWDKRLPFPMNDSWGYHDAATGNGKYDLYYKEMVKRYGEPVSMEDFSNKMQLLNAIGYQGIFEAAGHKLNETGGVMLWKLNAAFPSVIWQVYDWFLQPNAGYYFMQNACEPIHVQLNLDDSVIAVVNRTYHAISDFTVKATVFNENGKILYEHSSKISLEATEVKKTVALSALLKQATGICFVVLNLKDAVGRQISHNVYWLSAGNNYESFQTMPQTVINSKLKKADSEKDQKRWTIEFSNPSDQLAFFITPQLVNANTGEELLPSYWSTNYFTLAPHETIEVSVSTPVGNMISVPVSLYLKGWNIKRKVVPL